ncbi:MAG TPA: hypothetical protein VN132_02625 [Bdellovibrio sp.]|nr:hypothetical protein [Bdellovibrio sp.]
MRAFLRAFGELVRFGYIQTYNNSRRSLGPRPLDLALGEHYQPGGRYERFIA